MVRKGQGGQPAASTQHSGKLRGREATLAQTKEGEGDGTQQHTSCSHLAPWPLTAGMVLCPQPATEHTTKMAILRDQMGPAASQFSKPLPEAPKDPSIHPPPHSTPSPFCHPLSCSSPGCLPSPQALISLPASPLASSFPGASQAGWQPTAAAPSRGCRSPSSLYSSLLDLTLSPSSLLSNPSSPRTPRWPPFQRKKEQTKQEIKFAFYSRAPRARGAELPKVNWEESILLPAPFPLPGLNIPSSQ